MPAVRRWDVGPFQEDPSIAEQTYLQIEELQRRSGKRDRPRPGFDLPVPGNEGRDNMTSSWSSGYMARIGALPPEQEPEPEPPPPLSPEDLTAQIEAEKFQRERADRYQRLADMSRRMGPSSAIDIYDDRRLVDWSRVR